MEQQGGEAPPNIKRGTITAGHADMTQGTPVSNATQRQIVISCTAWRKSQIGGPIKTSRNDGRAGKSMSLKI